MHTGEKIRMIRTLKGLKQENMAEMLGLTRQAYGDIERGKTDVTDSRLNQIAEIFKMSPTDILELPNRMSIFFDNCSGQVGYNTGTQNNYGQLESQQQVALAHLEIEKLRLEVEKYRLERDILQMQLRQTAA